MKSIDQYIYDLLYMHDCVIIPRLGGFIANHQSAELNEESGYFYPPKKTIGFNRSLQHNDGLLINCIQNAESISYFEAQNKVNAFVGDFLDNEVNNSELDFKGIGKLKFDSGNNILFIPSNGELSGFLPESFGLSMIRVTPSLTQKQYDHKKRSLESIRALSHSHSYRKIAAAVALAAALFFISPELKSPRVISASSFSNIELLILKSENSDIFEEASQTEIDNSIEEAKVVSNESITVADAKYFLVIASFPDVSSAQAYCTKIKTKGFLTAEVIEAPGKNRVSIMKFGERAEAFASLDEYRSKKGFESCWLLKKK